MDISLPASIDTHLEYLNPTDNCSTLTSFKVGEDFGSTNLFRALMKFDLSGIQSDATILSAKLSLYRYIIRSYNSRTMRVYRVNREWVGSEATWEVFSTGNDWETDGCDGNNDREQSDIGSSILDDETIGWCEINLDEEKIQEMLTDGIFVNNGFLLKNDVELDDASRFYSSEHSVNSSLRPKLVIEYETPNPEPDSVSMVIKAVDPSIMHFKVGTRIRARKRDTFLRTNKKGILNEG